MASSHKAMIFNIQRFSTEDGPGIRTTVFFKGCQLRCFWCCNPESQKTISELSHRSRICTQCGKCVEVCEPGAISLPSKKIKVNRKICTNCGKIMDYSEFLDEELRLVKKTEERLTKKYNFIVQDHNIEFFGICKKCK